MESPRSLLSEPCDGSVVSCVKFGPHYQLTSLLAIGTSDNQLLVKRCTVDESELQNVDSAVQALHLETVLDSSLEEGMKLLSWSPESIVDESNVYIRLATALRSNRTYLVTSTRDNTNLNQLNIDTTKSLNDVAFHCSDKRFLATVGDDRFLRIWDIEVGTAVYAIRLLSPGMSVCFNHLEPQQIMVAEKNGRIKFYNQSTKQPIRSIESPTPSLLQADWSLINSSMVGAVAGNDWVTWDIRQSSLRSDMGVAHSAPSVGFKWSNSTENVFSTFSADGEFKIHHQGHKKGPQTHDVGVANDMSWHPNFPAVALATTNRISIFGVEVQ